MTPPESPTDRFRCWLRITLNKLDDHFRRTHDQARGVGGTNAQRAIDQIAAETDDPAVNAEWDDGRVGRSRVPTDGRRPR
jgi:hypothetical protein